jgi:hypothetical protein
MAIVVEDGTGKADAESFVTVAEAQAFASARSLTLPAPEADVEKLLVKAADFILGLEPQFKGLRSEEYQRLPFPRYNVTLHGWLVNSNEIPAPLKEAQIRLAISANTNELRPDGTGREVVRQKIGPIETEYSKQGSGTINPQFNQAMDFLRPLFRSGGKLTVDRL